MKIRILLFLSLSLSLLQAGSVDWLKPLRGKLSEILIPGTHDSGALHGSVYSKCQLLTIEQQLNMGIRFLDVRCRHLKNDFAIYHGSSDQKQRFSEVLKVCSEFLKMHPSECVVLSIKEESFGVGNTRGFGVTYQELIKPYSGQWYAGDKVPLLQQVRGKMVVISRHSSVKGISWGSVFLQDQYKVSGTAQVRRKWQLFLKHAESDAKARAGKLWSFNYATGNGVLSPPSTVAKYMNVRMLRYVEQLLKDGEVVRMKGVVALDFPTKELVEAIINLNSNNNK